MPRDFLPFTSVARPIFSTITITAALCLAPIMCAGASGPHASSSDFQAATQSQPEVILLEPGKPLKINIAAGQKYSYGFDLLRGQYASLTLDFSDTQAKVTLLDPMGAPIDENFIYRKEGHRSLEIVAESTGRYGLDIAPKTTPGPPGSGTIELGLPRAASDNDFVLQHARELTYQASILTDARKFDDAIEPAQKALEIDERVLGPNDASVAHVLFLLGNIYLGKTDFHKAEPLFLRALKILEKTSPGSVRLFSLLNNLGALYSQTDELDKAESTLERSLQAGTTIFGADSPAVGNIVVNLANVHDDRADYSNAELLYRRAVAITEKNFGANYPGLAVILSNLSGVCSERGDYVNAESFGLRALSILEKLPGPENPRLGLVLVNLGDVYRLEGQPDKAEPLYEHALNTIEKTQGADNPLFADTLSNLGEIYHDRRQFTKAEIFYKRSLAIREKKLGAEHSSVASSLDNLGSLYRDQGDYARAEPLYERALAIQEKTLGPEHPDVVGTLTSMSTLQMARGNFAAAETLLSRAIAISERNADLNLLAGSERQKLAYLKLFSSQLDEAITLNAHFAPDQPAARNLALTTLLQRKGRVLDVLADSLKVLRLHVGSDDVELRENFDHVTSQLARLVLAGPQQTTLDEHERRVASLKQEREHLEAEISAHSAEFRAASQPVTLEAVRLALTQDCVLLEFASYHKFVSTGITDKQRRGPSRYAVYALRPDGHTEWKDLGDAKTIDAMIAAYRGALRDPKRNDVFHLSRTLDEKILEPVRKFFGDATHLLISPDGQLSLIPFESLMDRHAHFAVERYSITYLTSGRDLLRMQVPRADRSGPIVVADPFFGAPGAGSLAPKGPPKAKLVSATVNRPGITVGENLSNVYFAPLAGTAREASEIQSLFPKAKLLTGKQASKAALKDLEAPRFLHIATHGFFLEDVPPDSPYSRAGATRGIRASAKIENPLLRSGLALAGANLDKGAGDDGILTALEASDLNLWGTKLVTLSACDTGVGEVRDGEGVYGLRRAFFLAGTETLVMSLWPVSDTVTRELMAEYYLGLKNGLGRGEALRQAQLAMLKRKQRHHPFYWASFIQSGEWANLDGKR